MALFKLKKNDANSNLGELVHASESKLELEKHLENWLENSPWAIAEETLLIIGRQPTANKNKQNFYPDLIALDKDGSFVVIELKKGPAPRDVTAQVLEYASWADTLSESKIIEMAETYLSKITKRESINLRSLFCDTFETNTMPELNQHLRLYIAAEKIDTPILNVCEFLRTSHSVDISCVEFSIYQTESDETLISTEMKVGYERIKTTNKGTTSTWSGEKSVKDVVHEAVVEITSGNTNKNFTLKDLKIIIHNRYQDFKLSNVGAEITADCVNHPSRHHHSTQRDYYWRVDKGIYKLYDSSTDKDD